MSKKKKSQPTSHGVLVPKTYRNPLSCGLLVVEEMLSDMSLAVKNTIARHPSGAGNSPDSHWRAVKEEIQSMQDDVMQMQRELDLERRSENPGGTILSRCSKVWETLHNLKPAHLSGYGSAPPELSAYLDTKLDTMLTRVDHILDETKTLGPDSSQHSLEGDSKNRSEGGTLPGPPKG